MSGEGSWAAGWPSGLLEKRLRGPVGPCGPPTTARTARSGCVEAFRMPLDHPRKHLASSDTPRGVRVSRVRAETPIAAAPPTCCASRERQPSAQELRSSPDYRLRKVNTPPEHELCSRAGWGLWRHHLHTAPPCLRGCPVGAAWHENSQHQTHRKPQLPPQTRSRVLAPELNSGR